MTSAGLPTVVALYLPQFHPIPENDTWWGKGFTEWTNVAKARPLFSGHRQPNLPADLGFYDLRVPEVREQQAALARENGVSAFCYYHYWFGNGRRILQRPFEEVLASGQPDFPFMLCWANQTWSGVWHGLEKQVLVEQQYLGDDDDRQHFECVLRAFRDPRYLRVQGKPVFMVYQPSDLPDSAAWTARWRERAARAGLPGLYLVAEHGDPHWDPTTAGFDAFVNMRHFVRRRQWTPWSQPVQKLRNKWLDWRGLPTVRDYRELIDYFVPRDASDLAIPVLVPNWDNTPRSSKRGVVLSNATPEHFGRMVDHALERCRRRSAPDNLLFVKSWNEWAEGNHLEPGIEYGHRFLDELRRRLRPADGLAEGLAGK